MRLIAEFCTPVLHISEDLIQVGRVQNVYIKLRLHRVGVVLRVNNQHPITLRERNVALHHRQESTQFAMPVFYHMRTSEATQFCDSILQ